MVTDDPRYKIDETRRVYVYKNLHRNCYSVRQDGLVKMHTDEICLYDAQFRVGKKGRERVIEEGRKNVHAYVKGCVILNKVKGLEERKARKPKTLRQVTYNPYKYETFVYGSNPAINSNNHEPILWSSRVRLTHIDGDKARIDAVPCIKSANCY